MENNTALDCYPLSNSQMNIWALEQSFPGISLNNICETIRIRGTLDIALLQKCLNLILENDASLRLQIMRTGTGAPVQYEVPYAPCQFPVFDFSASNETGIRHWESSITREVMPVLDSPLFYFAILKISEHEGGVFVKTHHLISDGWSQVALINRIAQTYLALLNGETVALEPSPSYRLHVEEEQHYCASPAFERDRQFWKQTLAGLSHPPSIKDCNGAEISPVGQRKTFWLSERLNHAFSSFCTSHRIAPFAVFYLAIAIYLKRIRGADKICIGAPIHNRGNRTDRLTTGMFVSTLPFFSELEEDWSFEECNQRLADSWLELLRHQKYPFSEITGLAKQENPNVDRLFHLVLSFHNSQAYRNRDTSIAFSGQWHYAGYQAEHLCIHLNNMEDNRRYSINYDYLTQLFCEQEIENFHHYLVNILTQALADPQKSIRELCLLQPDEEEKVLYTFNRTDSFYFGGTLWQKLLSVCSDVPSRVAVIQNGERFTYRQLQAKANGIAREIAVVAPGGRKVIALLLHKSFTLYAAMAGVMQAGCAWLILSTEQPKERLLEILSGSGAAAVLGSQDLLDQFGLSGGHIPALCPDTMADSEEPAFPCPVGSTDLAYIVYTSGSTGKPKGVEIEQRSLLNFAEAMAPIYSQGAVLSLCNSSFDAFLLESAAAMLNGCTVVLPADGEQEDPARLAELIRRYAVGFLALTPSRLNAYLKNPAFRAAAARLESIVCGGEAFPASLLKLLSRCTNARIYNQYGPSETTVGVSGALLNGAALISVGSPMPNCRCYVLDKHRNPLPIGVYGDLYIGGVCVGRGYHNAPELTAATFLDSPFEPGERLYRTGDIAAWTANGELLLKGREDGQVKLRGQRIELDEVAARLSLHPAVRQAAARLVSLDGQDILTAYYVAEAPVSESELLEFAATYLPGYMIPAAFVALTDIPLTPNGKTDYARLPLPRLETETALGAVSAMQETILSVFRSVLNRPDMTVTSDYFLCGGDSLNALETLSALESAFGVRLRVADLAACRTAQRLETRLGGNSETAVFLPSCMQKAPELSGYPLTPAQLGMYFETQMAPERTSYNMPCGFRVPALPDVARLQAAFQQLVDAESTLRTVFVPETAGICQRVLPAVPASLESQTAGTLEEACAAFVRPFDLSRAPLMRLAVWQDADGSGVVLMDLHHIVGDAFTAALLLRRLEALYRGKTPAVPFVTYPDYAWWRDQNSSRLIDTQQEYWRGQMDNAPALPDIPTDFPRPKRFDFLGAVCECALRAEDTRRCEKYCERTGLTPFMLFAGAFGILLSKLSGSRDFFVGTPVSVRRDPALAETAGLFVNTLPLRLAPRDDLTVSAYLAQVRDRIIGMLDHPDIPLDTLVSMAGASRSDGQNALYNTLISMRPVDVDAFTFDGMAVEPVAVPAGSAKLELNLEVSKGRGCYRFRLEYARSLFDADTVALLGRSLIAVVQEILRADDTLLSDCSAVSPADRFTLFEQPRALCAAYIDLSIDRRFDAVADIHPDAPAFIFHGETLTFGEIKAHSDALAGRLQREGVQPGDRVGILSRRGPELPVAMLAVLKAGAAYVPMLPSFPENRLQYMMDTSETVLTLCDKETLSSRTAGLTGRFLEITHETAGGYTPPVRNNAADICFVLFTSGSTGQPKGVRIRHRSVSNLLAALSEPLSGEPGGFLCTTNAIFDIYLTETLIAMVFGHFVVMADEEEMLLPWKTAELIRRHGVKRMQFTPSRAQLFLDNAAFFEAVAGTSLVILAGEALKRPLVQKFREAGCGQVWNMYGPTEATVYATAANVTDAPRVTIGRVFPNCRGYILDSDRRPVMPAALGELCLAGECLSDGYAGRDDLTQQYFVPDPFFPGQTMYCTGDIVRLLPDGQIEYIGRRDHQIKLNGQRIELAEITQKILDSGLVAQAATIVNRDGSFASLRAFVEPRAGEAVDPAAIRQALEAELPAYMIPSEILVLSALPRTASGKMDVKALEEWKAETETQTPVENNPPAASSAPSSPETVMTVPEPPAVSAASPAPEAAAKDPVAVLPPLWKATLSANTVDADRSFFEQGGTSLGALNLLSQYYNHHFAMTLADFYDHPTLNAQIALLGGTPEMEKAAPAEALTARAAEFAASALPQAAVVPAASGISKNAVLLTGATGFLGAHLLRALLEEGYSTVICPVRGDPRRLETVLSWYFGSGWYNACAPMIEPVAGDITADNCGIADDALPGILARTGLVVHAAADVRHYASDDEPERTNRTGTANAIALAKKANARLVHISTVSLGGEYLLDSPQTTREFTEQDFDIGQNWRDNIYLRGKFGAEELVRAAAADGLSAVILRVGRLVGRSTDGVFQKNASSNALWSLINGLCCLEQIDAAVAEMPMELTAVDECARAAVMLRDAPEPVYHLFNPQMLPIRELLFALRHRLAEVDSTAFQAHLSEKLLAGYGAQLAPLLAQYNRLLRIPMRITPVCDATTRELQKRGFVWKTPNAAMLLRAFPHGK